MYDAEQTLSDLGEVDALVARATDALLKAQQPDGHWVFELEADATIPAEFVLLKHYLGEPEDLDLEARIGRYLLPPCGVRELAGKRPICPEGPRFCGVPVWKLKPEDYLRTI